MNENDRSRRLALLAVIIMTCGATLVFAEEGKQWESKSPLSPKVEKLIRKAHDKKAVVRENAIGELLGYLQRGMTPRQVEAWLGPPTWGLDARDILKDDGSVLYSAKLARSKRAELIAVHYDMKQKPPRLVRVLEQPMPVNREPEDPLARTDENGIWQGLSPLSGKVQRLIRQTRNSKADVRERAVGELLSYLQPGMTRNQVEAWLGQPDWHIDLGTVMYNCKLLTSDRSVMMTVHYDMKGKPLSFVRVKGPLKKHPKNDE